MSSKRTPGVPFVAGDARTRSAARKGGAASVKARQRKEPVRTALPDELPGPLDSIADAVVWSSWATRAVACGRLDARTAREVSTLLRTFIDGKRHCDRVDERVRVLNEKLRKLTGKDAR